MVSVPLQLYMSPLLYNWAAQYRPKCSNQMKTCAKLLFVRLFEWLERSVLKWSVSAPDICELTLLSNVQVAFEKSK
jgi:hypothetical protein